MKYSNRAFHIAVELCQPNPPDALSAYDLLRTVDRVYPNSPSLLNEARSDAEILLVLRAARTAFLFSRVGGIPGHVEIESMGDKRHPEAYRFRPLSIRAENCLLHFGIQHSNEVLIGQALRVFEELTQAPGINVAAAEALRDALQSTEKTTALELAP